MVVCKNVCILHIKSLVMKRILLFFTALLAINISSGQLLTWSPQFPNDNSSINVTVDATLGNQGLLGSAGPIYMHLGVITNLSTSNSDWKYVTTTWGTTTAPAAVSCGTNKWCYTVNNPRAYFNVPAGETIKAVAILFRDATGAKVQKNADGGDTYVPIYPAGNNYIKITTPTILPTNPISNTPVTGATVGQSVNFAATSSVSGSLSFTLNGNQFASATAATTISGTATAVSGNNQVIAWLNGTASDTFNFYVAPTTNIKALPSGVVEGINYYNCTDSVTLVLYAPNKTSCMLIGDFPGSNWTSQTQYQMYKTPDGNYYWITVHGLTSGTEYAYQYIVDNSIYIADPYCEKILDPWNDPHINPNSYPNLKAYPSNSNVSAGKNGYVSVLQPCAPQYTWTVPNFTKPDSKQLIIYELLPRDFVKLNPPAAGYDSIGNFQAIIDSINYFKTLGINAVELMPVQEFSGNQSWGYNPTFYFAPDKVYGSKNKLKELIDTLHKNGIAVILDVVYNQEDASMTPHGKLYWDAANSRPASNNPWLNPTAPHMFSVFNDFNHSSTATQYFVERSLEHWLKEYKVDGFRFDLAKGFTQNSGTESTYDASRVGYFDTYYNYVKGKGYSPYFILEFLGALSEEQAYVNKGMFPWRKMTSQYNEATMGQTGDKNFGNVMWNYNNQVSTPGLVGYMESHDEERLMYKNLQYGASAGSYNVKTLSTALARMEAAGSLFLTVPGPKMIWQFGELGYDYSINYGGSNVSNKPPRWDYLKDVNRKHLFDIWSKIIKFRTANPAVFTNTPTAYDFDGKYGFVKYLQIGDPNINNTQVTIVANFDVAAQSQTFTFQKTGNWSNYVSNGTGAGMNGSTGTTFTLSATSQTITLQPGEYHIYISVPNCIPPATPSGSVTVQPTCATPTGTIVLTAPTGTNIVYSVNGSTYQAGTTFAGLSPAVYSVTAKDNSTGCVSPSLSLTVNAVPSAPATPTGSVTVQPTCTLPTGTIAVTAPTGSNIMYSVNGSTYQAGGTFSGLAPATYSVTAKDNSTGCVSSILSLAVNAIPANPSTPVVTLTQPNCPVPSGTIAITSPTGTNIQYSINGSTYQSGATFSGLAPAAYNVTAKDNSTGCISSATAATINAVPTAPAAPTASVTLQPTCTVSGTINVTAPTGTNIEYSINGTTYQSGGIFSGLAPNSYSVTARNSATLCVSAGTVLTVNPPPGAPATPTGNVTVQPTCTTPTGTITVTAPTGANIQYSVNGTAYQPSGTFTGLTPGTTYSVTAKDVSTGCVSSVLTLSVSAIPVAPATPTASVTVQPTCTTPTGTIAVTAPAGANIQYSMNGTTYQSAGTFTGLTPGTAYSLTAKDISTGCVSSALSLTVSAIPAAPAAPSITVTQPTCPVPSGSIVISSPLGANIQYSINGSTYQAGTTFSGLTANTYNMTAKNTTTGCVSGQTATIINAAPIPPAAPAASVTVQPTCSVAGTIVVTAPVGTNIEYSINGTTYQTSGTFSGLAPGSYTVTARNIVTQCVSAGTSLLVNPIPGAPTTPTGSVTVQPTCTTPTGTIVITSPAGANIVYSVNGTNYQSSGTFTGLTPNTSYQITAKDNSTNCVSSSVNITVNAIPAAPATPTASVTVQTGCINSTGTIVVSAPAGANILYSVGAAYQSSGTFTGLAPATYSITAKDNSTGCISPASQLVINALPTVPDAPTVTSSITYCLNATAVSLASAVTGGTNLKWYNSLTGTPATTAPVPSTNAAGSTVYYVTQSNTCFESPKAAITVTVKPLPATPGGLTVSAVTNKSAVLSWTAVSGAASYTVEYKATSSSIWTTISSNVSGISIDLSGLSQSTSYDWRVSANCAAGSSGDFGISQFTTSSFSINNIKNGLGIMVYPNPALSTGKIAYIVPADGVCKIVLYNSVGQKINVILDATKAAGQYELPMSDILKKISGGVYFLQIKQGSLSNYTKFIKP